MNEQETPGVIKARRAAAKARRREERAKRSAAIDAAWMDWMYGDNAFAKQADERAAWKAASRAEYRIARAADRREAAEKAPEKPATALVARDANGLPVLTPVHFREAEKALESGRRLPFVTRDRSTPPVNPLAEWLGRSRPPGGDFSGSQVRFMRDVYRAGVELLAGRNS